MRIHNPLSRWLNSRGCAPVSWPASCGRPTVCSISTWLSSTIFPSWRPGPWRSSSLMTSKTNAVQPWRRRAITAPSHGIFSKLCSCSNQAWGKATGNAGRLQRHRKGFFWSFAAAIISRPRKDQQIYCSDIRYFVNFLKQCVCVSKSKLEY